MKSLAELESWVNASDAHRESELGFLVRFSKQAGLDRIGKAHDNFIRFGPFDLPENTLARGLGGADTLLPSGVITTEGRITMKTMMTRRSQQWLYFCSKGSMHMPTG